MIGIIGAGITGVAAAIWLQRQGLAVTLIDRLGAAGGASFGNGGVVVPSGIVPVNSPGLIGNAPKMLLNPRSPLFMRWSYLPKLLPWLIGYLRRATPQDARRVSQILHILLTDAVEQHHALSDGTPAARWLTDSDYLFVYPERQNFLNDRFGWGLRQEAGMSWEEMNKAELEAYDAGFASAGKFAIRFKDHAQVGSPGDYVKDLADHFVAQGGTMAILEAEQLRTENGKVRAIATIDGDLEVDQVVVTAGVWSGKIMQQIGFKVPLESERGYHIDLHNPSAMPRSPMMLAAGKFVVSPMHQRIRCAGIVEFGGTKLGPSRKPLAMLREHIARAYPDLEFESTTEWLGHRPAPIDSVPFIGPVKQIKGVYAAFGHHHVGLTAGAVSGRLVSDLIIGKQPDRDISACDLGRFTR